MRTSCIPHPEKEKLVIIREWQVEFCDNNHCAAALLSYFEYWHSIRLAQSEQSRHANLVAQQHGEEGQQDESLLQFHSQEEIKRDLLNLYSLDSIRAGVDLLVKKGVITKHNNPNPRFKFDRTIYYAFHTEQIIDFLDNRKIGNRQLKNQDSSPKNQDSSPKNQRTIKETTTEITKETMEEEKILRPTSKKNSTIAPEAMLASQRLANHLDSIPGTRKTKEVDIQRWARDIDKLNRIDQISWELINGVLTWLFKHHFWSDKIQSGDKLRLQWNKLVTQMTNDSRSRGPKSAMAIMMEKMKQEDKNIYGDKKGDDGVIDITDD